MQLLLVLMIVSLSTGALCQTATQTTTTTNRRRPQTQMNQQISLSSIIPSNSQYTEGNIYDILSVALLATLGSFILPSLSTFLTFMVASNPQLLPKLKPSSKNRPKRNQTQHFVFRN